MTKPTIPAKDSRSHALLTELQKGPGTFYQICERAGFDIEDSQLYGPLRKIFDHLIGGNVRLVGIMYHITDEARLALGEAPPAPYVGQVAGPAYRGTPYQGVARTVRREAGARI